jgi:hypothetical protein
LPRRWPGFDSRSRSDLYTFRVDNVALFCNPASGGTFSSTATEIIKWGLKNCSRSSKGVPHFEAWVRPGRGIPHGKGHDCVLRLVIPKNKCVKKHLDAFGNTDLFRNPVNLTIAFPVQLVFLPAELGSLDPDYPDDAGDLIYQWFCRRISPNEESYREVDADDYPRYNEAKLQQIPPPRDPVLGRLQNICSQARQSLAADNLV